MFKATLLLLCSALCFLSNGIDSQEMSGYDWKVIVGSCTAVCGSNGVKPSMVVCQNTIMATSADLSFCNKEKMPDSSPLLPCNRKPCPGEWVIGKYGPCSDVCNGVQSRDVYCRQLQENDLGMIRVSDDECTHSAKPATRQSCGESCIAPKFYREIGPPSLPVPRQNIVCYVGENTTYIHPGYTLTIDVVFEEGYPTPNVMWTLPDGTTVVAGGDGEFDDDRRRIHMLKNGSLVVHNIQKSDEGTYVAVGENVAGLDRAQTKVVVVELPVFNTEIPPSVTIVHAGNRLLIRAELMKPSRDVTFVWTTATGVVLGRGKSSGKFSVLMNGTLAIDDAQEGEAGTYEVVARTMGGTTRASTQLVVIDYEWVSGLGECSETCGDSGLQFSTSQCVEKREKRDAPDSRCIVAGREKPSFAPVPCNRFPCVRRERMWKTSEWLPTPCKPCVDRQTRSIECLETAEDLGLGNKSISIVKDVACAGISIPLTRRVCSETLCPAAPRFRVPPEPAMPFNMSPIYNRYDLGQSVIGVEGRSLYVDAVLAEGYPKPTVTWLFDFDNGTELRVGESLDRYHVFENGTLRIDDVTYGDQGLVETMAINSEGEDRVVFSITIYVPPKIVALKAYRNFKPVNTFLNPYVMVRPGDTVAMQCRITGSPTPTYGWFRNGAPVIFEGRFKTDSAGCLIITNVAKADSDVYECVAENMVGVDRRSVSLDVKSLERAWARKYFPCSRECGGGTQFITSECRNSVTKAKVNDSECGELSRPTSKRVKCNPRSCLNAESIKNRLCTGNAETVKPAWIALEWSKCTKLCGRGKQKRLAKCVNPCTLRKTKGCNPSEKPLRHRRCNVFRC